MLETVSEKAHRLRAQGRDRTSGATIELLRQRLFVVARDGVCTLRGQCADGYGLSQEYVNNVLVRP